MPSKKPTLEEILALLETCRTYYGEVFKKFDEDEKFYELNFKDLLRMPKEFKDEGITLPTARDMVDTCVDHTNIHNARVFVNRKGTSNISEDDAEMMRKFYLGLIQRTEVESSISPWRTSAKHYWLHGLTYLKTVWDADLSIDKPIQKKGESEDDYAARLDSWRDENNAVLPIVIQAVHPRNVMYDPFGTNSFVFEVQEKLCYNVSRKWKNWSNPKEKTLGQMIEHISFWTPEYRCELYDGEPVLRVPGGVDKHGYGFLPYVAIDSGLGNLSSKADPDKRYVGVLRYIRDILVSESRNYSTSDCVLKRTAWPWGTIEGDNAEQAGKIEQTFGTYTPMPKGTKLVQQTPQVPPGALQELLNITTSYITSHAAPNSVRGLGESGVRSGTDRRQVIAEASTRYAYSEVAYRNGATKVLTNCAHLFKNIIPGDLRVWARTKTDEFDEVISKNKMKEPFTCYIEFAPISEEDEYTRHDDLERLVQSGIVTPNWARKQMSNVDPVAMEIEDEVQKLKNDPMVQQLITQYAASKIMEALTKRSRAEAIKNPPPPIDPALGRSMMSGQGVGQGMDKGGQSSAPRSPSPSPYDVAGFGSPEMMQNDMAKLRAPKSINGQGEGGGGYR